MPLTPALAIPLTPNVIVTYGLNAEPLGGVASGAATGALTSGTMSTTTVYAVPFQVWDAWTVKRLALVNGATVNGNWDIGIYAFDGATKIVSTGSTAQSGTTAYQGVNVTATVLGPGFYWLAYGTDSATQTIHRWVPGSNWSPIGGMMMHTVASGTGCPLPASLTLVTTTTANVPFLQAANDTIF